MVDELQQSLGAVYTKQAIYEALGKTRQGFSQSKQRADFCLENENLIISIVINWRINHPRMGSRVMHQSLKEAGIYLGIGITKFEQLLSKYNLTVGKIKRYGPKTTDSNGSNKDYPNLTNGLIINDINQLIVADITYFWINGKWYYLFIFKDVYSQRVLCVIPSRNMEGVNCHTAFDKIVALRGKAALINCIFHSDNGGQFDANKFVARLVQLGIKISRAGHCEENGSAEQINHIIKNMYLNNWSISSFEELCEACKVFVKLNNSQRTIKQLGYKTPLAFEAAIAKIPLSKRIKKQLYDFDKA